MKKILIISLLMFIILISFYCSTYATDINVDNIVSDTIQNNIDKEVPKGKTLKEVLIIPPTKTKYDVGENLNLDGLAITAVYDNDKIEQIDIKKNNKDYKITGFNKNKEGYQTVTISYKGFSRSYEVKVGNVAYNVDDEGKLPQTGDFSILKFTLYCLIAVLSSVLIFIVYKSFKYRKF